MLKLDDQYTCPVKAEDTEMLEPVEENENFHSPLELKSGVSPGYIRTLLKSTFDETGGTYTGRAEHDVDPAYDVFPAGQLKQAVDPTVAENLPRKDYSDRAVMLIIHRK
jgi:hypothetical protein